MPISASTSEKTALVKTALEQNTSINLNIGCTFEYNMNSMVDNIVVTGADITAADGSKPFKKLFPIDSVIKPARPLGAGVKYGISGDVSAGTYRDPRSSIYSINYRTYYPGADTYYKYWISGIGVGVDLTITYPKAVLTNKIISIHAPIIFSLNYINYYVRGLGFIRVVNL